MKLTLPTINSQWRSSMYDLKIIRDISFDRNRIFYTPETGRFDNISSFFDIAIEYAFRKII